MRILGLGKEFELSTKEFGEHIKKIHPEIKTLFLSENNDVISVDMIEVEKDNRKQGVGTAVMNDIVSYADANNKTLEALPGLQDDRKGTTSRGRLVNFYKRFGFVENKGRNKDFSRKSGAMYRTPSDIRFRKGQDFRDGHGAPAMDYKTLQEAIEESGDVNLSEIITGKQELVPDSFFDTAIVSTKSGKRGYKGAIQFGYNTKSGIESIEAIKDLRDRIKEGAKPEKLKAKAYRAVPNSVEVNELIDRDWVTLSKDFADKHGLARFGKGEYKIIEQDVPINKLWWDGNDINEIGYDVEDNIRFRRGNADNLMDNADNFKDNVKDYNAFLNNALNNAADKQALIDKARSEGLSSLPKVIEQYLAEIDNPAELEAIKNELRVDMPDEAMRYLLWRNANPNDGSVAWRAKESMKMQELDPNVLFRRGLMPLPNAFNEYERRVRSRYNTGFKAQMFRIEEGWFDKMTSLRILQEAIAGKDIPGNQNAYQLENQLSSKNAAEIERYNKRVIEPMLQAVHKVFGNSLTDADLYLMAKHGLERNDKMAYYYAQ